jgi:GDP-L-fucose synthase|tara:strand:- start:270 stop:1208 length:939 start_codon:yes stop_codon:yes gene_type:complete
VINFNSKIYVAGHNGLVGGAIFRELRRQGYKNLICATRKQLDLTNQKKVFKFLKNKKPKFIFIAAAKVGGIYSNNKYKADFIYQNLSIQNNLIHGAFLNGIKNLIFLGSSCVYPRKSKQPIKESYLLSGELEPTNEPYAIAKIAGIKMCQSYNQQYGTNYRCLMPTNTFGAQDNYNELNSHFFPALIKKIDSLKNNNKNKLLLWGNGQSKREVIYVDDLANACVYFMNKKTKHNLINIGTGKDYTIKYYAQLISKIILPNKKIEIKYDRSKPNGTPRKVMDISLAKKYGWISGTPLELAILITYQKYLKEKK